MHKAATPVATLGVKTPVRVHDNGILCHVLEASFAERCGKDTFRLGPIGGLGSHKPVSECKDGLQRNKATFFPVIREPVQPKL